MNNNTQKNMTPEDIKIGEIYYARLKCIAISKNTDLPEFSFVAVDSQGTPSCDDLAHFLYFDLPAFSPNIPSEPPTLVDPAPKHDPCRLFKKGDIVRVVKYKGRPFSKFWEPYIGSEMQIVDNETDCENPSIKTPKGWQSINAAYLELITPVEEIVPYSVRHNDAHAAYSIYGPYGLSAANYFYGDRYPYSKHSAEAAAYAECDRLNAAYRKEQE